MLVQMTEETYKALGGFLNPNFKIALDPKAKFDDTDFKYPIVKKHINGAIAKFTALKTAIYLHMPNDGYTLTGRTIDNMVFHTDLNWTDVPYNEDRDLYHGQPVYCWDNCDTHYRSIRFYDAINDCSFDHVGALMDYKYDNYQAVPPNEITDWMREAYKTLEGI